MWAGQDSNFTNLDTSPLICIKVKNIFKKNQKKFGSYPKRYYLCNTKLRE